jgi:hypothetical protein
VASGGEKTVSGTPTTMPASGKLALFGDDMTAAFRFLLVVRRL